jgi:hypothetical protein
MGTPVKYVPNPMAGVKSGSEREKALERASRTPVRSTNEKFLKLTFDTVKDDDWREIIEKAVEQAKQGNPTARQWLSNYTIGIPRQMPQEDEERETKIIIVNNFPRPEPVETKNPVDVVDGEVNEGSSIQPSG